LYRFVFADAVAHGFDPASNLRDMDREGVDVAVLFPTLGLYIIWDDGIEPGISAAICRAYNNWLAEYCSHNRPRLNGVALIPLHDTGLAVEELRRAKNELGLSGIFWRARTSIFFPGFCLITLFFPFADGAKGRILESEFFC
jgi:predicted TIM-barrel fold metal-dependent hydrolase